MRTSWPCWWMTSIWAGSGAALVRLHKKASFKMRASLEELDYEQSRGLKKTLVLEFTKPAWISNHQNVIITGATAWARPTSPAPSATRGAAWGTL